MEAFSTPNQALFLDETGAYPLLISVQSQSDRFGQIVRSLMITLKMLEDSLKKDSIHCEKNY